MKLKSSCCSADTEGEQQQRDDSTCCPPKTETSDPCCSTPAEQEIKSECCPPTDTQTSCCPPSRSSHCGPDPVREKAGYSIDPYVTDWVNTPAGDIPCVSNKLSLADHRGRWAMRWGLGRDHYLVTPGLYAIGAPDKDSEVLISANYKLSFDVLRASLSGLNAWILVIDTKGVNVWCAAGKGTFGTDEIVRRVQQTQLETLVAHRRLIVPQLGAPGVSAQQVTKGCGFKVTYGPVRAQDLSEFLAAGRQATPEMRRVHFNLRDRTILTPVEITILRKQIFYTALILLLLGGLSPNFFSFSAALTRGGGAILSGLAGLLAGAVITPIFLPWLPGRAFALKGVWPGLLLGFLLGVSLFSTAGHLNQIAILLQVTAISSYTAMSFTGSSTYTSPSGVEKEMRLAIPGQLVALVLAMALWLWSAF